MSAQIFVFNSTIGVYSRVVSNAHPRPLTGSQPAEARKPVESQLGLLPLVTSLNTSG